MDSVLLHRFIDMYERRPQALEMELERLSSFEDESVPLIDQAIALGLASRGANESIKRKTLIDTTSKLGVRHRQLLEELTELLAKEQERSPTPELQDYLDHPDLLEVVTMRTDAVSATYKFDEAEKFQRSWVKRASVGRLSVELLRMFADDLNRASGAIEQFDGTPFDQMIPPELAPV